MIDRWVGHRAAPWVVFAVLSVLYGATIGTGFLSVDVVSNQVAAQHFANAGDPWVEHAPYLNPTGRDIFVKPHGDHLYINRTPGQIFVAVPLYALLARGATTLQTLPGGLTAALLSAAAMALLFAALRRLLSPQLTVLATAAVALTTPVWSVAADALWTHPVTIVGICLAIWASAAGRGWLTGLGYAVAITARPHVAVIALVHGVHEAVVGRSVRPLVTVGLPSAASLGLSLAWNRYLTGGGSGLYGKSGTQAIPGTGESGGAGFLLNLVEFLVAPSRGLLVWTPMLLVLAWPVLRSWRRQPAWARAVALGGVAYLLVQASLNVYSGGAAFYGYRLGLEPLVCLAPVGFLAVRSAGPWPRRLLAAAIGWQTAIITIGAVGNGADHDAIRHENLDQVNSPWPNGTWFTVSEHPWVVAVMLVLFLAGFWASRRLLAESPLVSEHSLT